MRKKFKILKLNTKEVDTKYGKKKKFNLQGETSRGKFWADSWCNKGNQSWSEGITVEADIVDREYEGKTYFTAIPIPIEEIILDKLIRIESLLTGEKHVESAESDEPPPHEDEDMPQETEEIPF